MPNMERAALLGGPFNNIADLHATPDCRACLGRDMPTYLRTYDNHAPLGHVCRYCIGQLTMRGRRTTVGQCSFCYDSCRVRRTGKASACSYCVRSLKSLAAAA